MTVMVLAGVSTMMTGKESKYYATKVKKEYADSARKADAEKMTPGKEIKRFAGKVDTTGTKIGDKADKAFSQVKTSADSAECRANKGANRAVHQMDTIGNRTDMKIREISENMDSVTTAVTEKTKKQWHKTKKGVNEAKNAIKGIFKKNKED